ncbi:MAG: Lrp/AsnC family transcriptional regulator [Nitrososphaeria archaeon]
MMDEKDWKILCQLMNNGRKSVVDISDDLGIPRATVQERIRKLVDEGIIKGFTAIPNYQKIGKEVTAYVLVSFSRESNISQKAVAQEIAEIPDVYEISLISGEWDIILKVRAASVTEIGNLVIEKLRMMKGIEKTQTCVCFQTIKETP